MNKLDFIRFIAQRVTGGLLIILLAIHLGTVIYATRGGISVSEISLRIGDNAAWFYMYLVFAVLAISHAALGLRNVLYEMLSGRILLVRTLLAAYTVGSVWLAYLALHAVWMLS